MKTKQMLDVEKEGFYRKITIFLFLVLFGATLNMLAIKTNDYCMPVDMKSSEVDFYILTDIFPFPFTDYFFSVGDIVLFLSGIYGVYLIISIHNSKN